MERVVEDFILYLHETKNTSKNTEVSYERDLKKLIRYLQEQNLTGFSEVTCTDLQGYLNKIKSENLAASTISRNIASIRALYHYLIKTGIVSEDPTEALHTPKIEKKLPEILSVEEVDRLLKQPDIRTPKGIRDNAMMELLYATGMRVSELIHLKTGSSEPSGMTPHDLDDRDGFFFVDVGICRDFTDCGSNVFGGTSEARGMVGIYQIIINRLRFTDHADRTANACRVAGKFTDGIHRIIATNIEEPTDIEFLKFAEKCRINRIFERFRQFVAAGTEISTRGMS